MRDVDFIFVVNDSATQVATSLADSWEVTTGIRLNDNNYAKTAGMNLRGGFITARVAGSKATKSSSNFPTGGEIVEAMKKLGDVRVHFGNSSRGTLYLSWKEYQQPPSYTDALLGKMQKITMTALGGVDLNRATHALLNYTGLAQKAVGTVASRTAGPELVRSAAKILAGKNVPLLLYISNRPRGEGFTEIRKKRRVSAFTQIAGILAGTDITKEQFESFGGDDAEDVASTIDDVLGKLSTPKAT